MKSPIYILLLLFFSFQLFQAQEEEKRTLQEINEDDLGNVTDEFQEQFFEALKQKAIENYEKAITALEKCNEIEPENAVVFFELGKNYVELEEFGKALKYFSRARELAPEKESILVEIYHTHRDIGDYDNAISSVMELLEFDENYRDDLANLYMLNENYDAALEVVDELDTEQGVNSYRATMRRQIYARTGNTEAQIGILEEGISKDPEDEQNYLNLIYIYSEQGKEDEAFKTAQELLETNPGSRLVHLALYKFYLDREEPDAAVNSMKIVFKSEEIDPESKFKVLNDFLIFVNENPEYEEELVEVSTTLTEWEDAPQLFEQLGDFYLKNEKPAEALRFFENGLAQDPDNFELTKNILLLQIEAGQYEKARILSSKALEIFPAQPFFYLLQGVALNNLEVYAEAEEILTFGLDYLIDNPRMKLDFYDQLSNAYQGLKDEKKAADFRKKVQELKKKLNND